jgi:hypothetical protein
VRVVPASAPRRATYGDQHCHARAAAEPIPHKGVHRGEPVLHRPPGHHRDIGDDLWSGNGATVMPMMTAAIRTRTGMTSGVLAERLTTPQHIVLRPR